MSMQHRSRPSTQAPRFHDGQRRPRARAVAASRASSQQQVRRIRSIAAAVGSALAVLLTVLLLFSAPGCGRSEAEVERLRVAVSIPPLFTFVEEMLPEDAEAILLMPPGSSPHTYEPKPGDVSALAGADLLVINGVGVDGVFEDALANLGETRPDFLRLSDVLTGAEAEAAAHADHDPATCTNPAHDHGDFDPHLWLDPVLMQRFLPVLRDAILAQLDDPAARAQVERREQELSARLTELHADYTSRLEPLAGAGFIAEHPAYGRLTKRYGLRQAGTMRPLAQVEPTPAVIQELAARLESGEARAIFVEPQFPADTANRLAALTGAPVLTLDPLGEGDWFAMMRQNLDALVEGLTPQP